MNSVHNIILQTVLEISISTLPYDFEDKTYPNGLAVLAGSKYFRFVIFMFQRAFGLFSPWCNKPGVFASVAPQHLKFNLQMTQDT